MAEIDNEKKECICYSQESGNNLEHLKFASGEHYVISIKRHTMLFVIRGSMHVSIYGGTMERLLNDGEFMFIPLGLNISCRHDEDTELLITRMINSVPECHLYHLSMLNKTQTDPTEIGALTSNRHMKHYTQSLVDAVNAGMRCERYIYAKAQEFIYLLFGTYSKEDCAKYFSLIASKDIAFSERVRNEYLKHRSVKKLAEDIGLTERQFRLQFRKVFGMNPIDWIEENLAKEIYWELCNSSTSIKVVASKFNFTQLSNFNRYCLKTYGATPTAIKESLVDAK